MKKRVYFIIGFVMGILFLCFCAEEKNVLEEKPEEFAAVIAQKTGDAKIFNHKIAASLEGHLVIFNFDGKVYREYPEISTNWIYPLENTNTLVSASFQKEVRLTTFGEDGSVIRNEVLFSGENLMIDPTLVKVGQSYLLTYIEIEGAVNNADKEKENGRYTVHCYASEDLKSWTALSDIVSYQNNIEDGDMLAADNKVYYIFEKEDYDKGPSSLRVISSVDNGKTWSNEEEIVASGADNELAAVLPEGENYAMYYSSDKLHIEESYGGAAVYKARLTNNLSAEETYIPVELEEKKGILLYDVAEKNNSFYFLYARDYFGANELVLKNLRKNP